MVAQHYRWDFIGLSTDTKPDSSNPKVANGSTYYESDTSKLYVWYNNQWYEKTATGGGGYELPIASSTTLGGVKIGEGLAIDEGGVLSASGGGGGEAGAFKILTSADYNYPSDNPTTIALWLLPVGTYYVDNSSSASTNISIWNEDTSTKVHASLFQIYKTPQSSRIQVNAFGSASSSDGDGSFGFRQYRIGTDGTLYSKYIYAPTSI
jgi:hypothetical protein